MRDKLERLIGSGWMGTPAALIDEILSIAGPAATPLPEIPDDDADFTPDLARKIIAKYQQMLRSPSGSAVAMRDALEQARGYINNHATKHGTTRDLLNRIDAALAGPHAQEAATPPSVDMTALAGRLADMIIMLDAPDAYRRDYIAAVCRATLSMVSRPHQRQESSK